jgi:predicted permease
MSLLARAMRRARYLIRRNAAEQEMDDEMRLHLELEIEDRIRRGLTPDEARRTALVDFGGVERFKEEARTARGVRSIQDLRQDASYAIRVLRKSPGFTVASVVTIAIGIAATTAVLSAVDAILLRPLPVPDPRRLFVLAEVWESGGRSTNTDMGQHMYPHAHYVELRDATQDVFTGLAGYAYGVVSLRADTDARPLSSVFATPNYFTVLGVRPALGRFFAGGSESVAAPPPEVVIGHDLWQREFAGDSAVLGRTLWVDSRPRTVVGVAPQGFVGTMNGLVAEIWLPTTTNWVTMFGRLRPGLSVEQALAALGVIGRRLEPGEAWQKITRMTLDPMIGPPAMARGPVTGFVGLLFVTAALVLAIAAANIAGMLLARSAYRRREIAVRLALGAGRGRLVRQLVTESVILCLLGGAAGLLLAYWLMSLVPAVQPPIGVRTTLDLRLDWRVLAASFGIALGTGVLAGLTPALQSTGFDLTSGLRGSDRAEPRRHGRSRAAFVVAQLAMSLVLLITGGLFGRALQRALTVDPGLDARGVVVTEIELESHGYDRARGVAFYSRLVDRLSTRPEVASVALGQWTPLSMGHRGGDVPLPDGGRLNVTWGVIGEGYLETMRIPVVTGRAFNGTDSPGSTPVVIINETLARRLWPGQSPLGQQVMLDGRREVIGVAKDGKYRSLDEGPTAFAFVPFAQHYSPRMEIYARSRGDVGAALAAIRADVRALDPNVALEASGLVSNQLGIHRLPQRVAAWCVGVFGMIGLALAALGIYGVIAYHVAQRTHELGIRLALGARAGDVVGPVLRQALVLVAVAIVIGVPVAMGIGRLLASFLYGVGATDPVTFASVVVLLGTIALLASYVPARRAARVDPMISLRVE